MMSLEDSMREIVKLPLATVAAVALAFWLRAMTSAFHDFVGFTMRTTHAIGPPFLAHGVITFRIVNQLLNG